MFDEIDDAEIAEMRQAAMEAKRDAYRAQAEAYRAYAAYLNRMATRYAQLQRPEADKTLLREGVHD